LGGEELLFGGRITDTGANRWSEFVDESRATLTGEVVFVGGMIAKGTGHEQVITEQVMRVNCRGSGMRRSSTWFGIEGSTPPEHAQTHATNQAKYPGTHTWASFSAHYCENRVVAIRETRWMMPERYEF
jgi:hypothetical protein